MANPEHLAMLKPGVKEWNQWRKGHPKVRPDLDFADLSGTDLSQADLFGAVLRGANLVGASLVFAHLQMANLADANLSGANLFRANLTGAIFSGANFSRANLNRANLVGANLGAANLSGANLFAAALSSADLSGADFSGARAGQTMFADVDLSQVNGLEAVLHDAPSSIAIDTVFKSKGKIPEVFLRGCGVPDEFIAYIGSMVRRPIEYYSCFISYSTKDQTFADRLYADL